MVGKHLVIVISLEYLLYPTILFNLLMVVGNGGYYLQVFNSARRIFRP